MRLLNMSVVEDKKIHKRSSNMNKKFLILGIVMMALFGSMVVSCDNGTKTTDYGWNAAQSKFVEEKYQGLWESLPDAWILFISIHEQKFSSGEKNIDV
jgi:hypothetical protein